MTRIIQGWRRLLGERQKRRNLLFFSTLLTLVVVFGGAVPLSAWLWSRPFWFCLYWVLCFLLVFWIIALALLDLVRIRRDHNRKMDALELELALAAEKARELARQELAKTADAGESAEETLSESPDRAKD